MDLSRVVGENVRRLRTAAGISLADLAAAGGLSKTTLHGIEQGEGNPTLSTLWALAAALKVPLGELIDSRAPAVRVVRAGEGPRADGEAVSARLLHRIDLRGTVEVYELDVVRAVQHSQAHQPGVRECIVLTEGRITTGPAESPAELTEGDSIQFDAAHPHVYEGHAPRSRAVLLMLHPDG